MGVLTILLWDVDGTLLTTNGAGALAWKLASADVLGEGIELSSLKSSGLIDPQIAHKMCERMQVSREFISGTKTQLLRTYEKYLRRCLAEGSARLLPNVAEILTRLQEAPNIHSYLMTGNTASGASTKVRHFELSKYFVGGFYSDQHMNRADLAKETIRQILKKYDNLSVSNIYVIGDTPHDISCARDAGVRAMAIATGRGYSAQDLRAHSPWKVYESLPSSEEFVQNFI